MGWGREIGSEAKSCAMSRNKFIAIANRVESGGPAETLDRKTGLSARTMSGSVGARLIELGLGSDTNPVAS